MLRKAAFPLLVSFIVLTSGSACSTQKTGPRNFYPEVTIKAPLGVVKSYFLTSALDARWDVLEDSATETTLFRSCDKHFDCSEEKKLFPESYSDSVFSLRITFSWLILFRATRVVVSECSIEVKEGFETKWKESLLAHKSTLADLQSLFDAAEESLNEVDWTFHSDQGGSD